MFARRLTFLLVLLCPLFAAAGERLTVAVASNFAPVAHQLAGAFTDETGHDIRISTGSTGKLYGQIVNGAPFDVFLAADKQRPALLESNGIGIWGTRRTFAIGSLVIWSRDSDVTRPDCRGEFRQLGNRRLAIANPAIAPYGRAAVEYLQVAGHWNDVKSSLVYGENISQTLQLVATGNAKLGIVAASQLHNDELPEATCTWPVPVRMHQPIEQQAIALARSKAPDTATQFIRFLCSDRARSVITAAGYQAPECGS